MKQMNKSQTILFFSGGMLMVIGAGCFAFLFPFPNVLKTVSWLFLIGAVMFSVIQLMQSYEGINPVVKRLKRIQSLADVFFILAGISMVDTVYNFLSSIFSNYETYLLYFYNKWVVLLLIAAVIEIYTVHRIDYEEKKRNSNQ